MSFGGVIKLNNRGYALVGLLVVILLYFRFHSKFNAVDEPISLPHLLQVAIRAAEAGGKLVVSTRNDLKIQSKGKTNEGMDDSVTTADFLSHCVMERIITGSFPTIKFISEEKDTACSDGKNEEYSDSPTFGVPNVLIAASDITVWIDPLDATHEYTEKLYQYVTTMVCVAIKGEPIIGVIHSPFSQSTSWAVVGHGYSNDLKKTLKTDKSEKIKVIISRSHSGTIQEVLDKNFKNVEVVIAAGAGYKALKVAQGNVDAYLHITAIKKWDVCAGDAILHALGGKMTTKHGKPLTYYNDTDVVNKDGLIATLTHDDLFVDKL